MIRMLPFDASPLDIAVSAGEGLAAIAEQLLKKTQEQEKKIEELRQKLEAAEAENARLKLELAAAKLALTHPHGEIGVSDHVEKISGYRWPGEVRSVFTNRAGEVRFVVECTVPEVAGALHIYNGAQIAKAARHHRKHGEAQ